MASGVKWEPAALSFTIALNKVAVAQLTASNFSSDTTYAFKVKTTNPKRYCVRPNVGFVLPDQQARVMVQLPALKEYPSDMGRCKDKFQVLTFALNEEQRVSLVDAENETTQRKLLTDLWASEAAKDANIDKIRCAFTYDSSYRTQAIPEEDGVVSPYSPERNGNSSSAAAAQTPYANVETVAEQPVETAAAETVATPLTAASHADTGSKTVDDAHKLRDALLAAERTNNEMRVASERKARANAAQIEELQAELQTTRSRLAILESAKERASGSGSKGGGFSLLTMLVMALLAFAGGIGIQSHGLVNSMLAPPAAPLPDISKAKPKLKPKPKLADEL